MTLQGLIIEIKNNINGTDIIRFNFSKGNKILLEILFYETDLLFDFLNDNFKLLSKCEKFDISYLTSNDSINIPQIINKYKINKRGLVHRKLEFTKDG
ncbi:hypothetical protein LEP1GSC199_2356 [Leptospira vanthielii serovar Holland str. Waz Holland = ATCC 700522]|uniref:Uncharacterized protein n=1 Tax=Leptospira vanthielii serovar Holland str. Waz Holland = ATCC 700522 TaxID=1218591 RepID=N1W0C2_9LEPT|nr:hypothetical protein LEP1GSC199_2356 [Leptospira vanthielii serovar Holland str. Waz Holland = ATCC 700522]